jgi:hypothetical protein
VYSANIVVLTVLSAEEVAGSALFPRAQDPVSEWRRRALLWQLQLPEEGWGGLLDAIALRRVWLPNGGREIILRYDIEAGQRADRVDLFWSSNRPSIDEYRAAGRPFGWSYGSDSRLRGQAWFLCDQDVDTLMHALEPFTELNGLFASVHSYWPETSRSISTAHALLKLLLKSATSCPPPQLAETYNDCLEIIIRARFGSETNAVREMTRRIVLRQLAADQERVPAAWLAAIVQRIRETVGKKTDEVISAEELMRIAREEIPGLIEVSASSMEVSKSSEN